MASRKEKKREKGFPLGPTKKKKKSSSHGTDESAKFKKMIKKKKKSNNNMEKKAMNDERNEIRLSNGAEKEKKIEKKGAQGRKSDQNDAVIRHPTAFQQLNYFLHQYQSAYGIKLSSIELDAYKGLLLPLHFKFDFCVHF